MVAFFVSFEENGTGSAVGSGVFTVRQGTSGYTNNDFAANTAVIPVTAGDYFELRVNSTSSSWDDIQAGNRTWFAIEVVETADAANPPYDFYWRKEGQPGASEVVFRQVLARRVRLETDFAGSVGLAGTAATADADFDVRKNGNSVGTTRFEAGSTTPTFTAAAAVTLEIGDELTVHGTDERGSELGGFGGDGHWKLDFLIIDNRTIFKRSCEKPLSG